MAHIRPFRGLRYNTSQVSLREVVAPPYDVISPHRQKDLYRRDPHNAVRLILGKELAVDDQHENRYSRAAAFLSDWLSRGALLEDPEENVYLYEQEFSHQGRAYLRWGLVAAVRIEDFEAGVILPHERTFAQAKEDRLRLLRACRTNLSQVFALYRDPDDAIGRLVYRLPQRSLAEVADDDGVVNRLYAIPGGETEELRKAFDPLRLYIADGHHRYETALRYRNDSREQNPGSPPGAPWDFVMMMLVSADSPGLAILPTHRVVRGVELPEANVFAQRVSRFFEMRPLSPTLEDLPLLFDSNGGAHLFAVYLRDRAWLLRLRDPLAVEAMAESGRTPTWRRLDVSLLHTALPRILPPTGSSPEIAYVVEPLEAKAMVDSGAYQAALFLRPTPVGSVLAIAEERECMPEKSTYFYPKLLSGLVMRKL